MARGVPVAQGGVFGLVRAAAGQPCGFLPSLTRIVWQAGENGGGERFGFGDANGFFGNAADADAEEEVALKHIQGAGDGAPNPIGFFTQSRN